MLNDDEKIFRFLKLGSVFTGMVMAPNLALAIAAGMPVAAVFSTAALAGSVYAVRGCHQMEQECKADKMSNPNKTLR